MHAKTDKHQNKPSRAAANAPSHGTGGGEKTFEFVNNRAAAAQFRKLQAIADASPQAARLATIKTLSSAFAAGPGVRATGGAANSDAGSERVARVSGPNARARRTRPTAPAQRRVGAVLQGAFEIDPTVPVAGPNPMARDTRRGRGPLWRIYNGVPAGDRNFAIGDLPQVLVQDGNWKAIITEGAVAQFFRTGMLHTTIGDTMAREAYLGDDGRAVVPLVVTVHRRMIDEHSAPSNADADAESLRRFNAAPGSGAVGYRRTFSWLIAGNANAMRVAASAAVGAGRLRASLFHGQQLGVRTNLSTRQVDVERREFRTRPQAVHAGAQNIAPLPGTSRYSGVITERAGGSPTSTITGSWNPENNNFELYHYHAAGLAAADHMQPVYKALAFVSPATGTRATIDAARTRMPAAVIAALLA